MLPLLATKAAASDTISSDTQQGRASRRDPVRKADFLAPAPRPIKSAVALHCSVPLRGAHAIVVG